MAMYIFQEVAPKVFYFTYCLQETDKFINFLEESESDETRKSIIQNWSNIEAGQKKIVSSDFSKEETRVDNRTRYIVNSLKATLNYCFGQYKLYNRIEEDLIMDSDHIVVKSNSNALQETLSGKYKSMFFINDEYEGGEISVPNGKYSIKPEKGSILIAPSDTAISMNPIQNGTQYVSFVSWH